MTLLAAVPRPATAPIRLKGEPASPLAVPTGCAFHPRCEERVDGCDCHKPALQTVNLAGHRQVACVHAHAGGDVLAAVS